MQITKEEREKVRLNLKRFRGSINEIAETGGYTREWVRLVLSGKYDSAHVLEIATTILEREQAKYHERQNAIRASLNRAMSYQ